MPQYGVPHAVVKNPNCCLAAAATLSECARLSLNQAFSQRTRSSSICPSQTALFLSSVAASGRPNRWYRALSNLSLRSDAVSKNQMRRQRGQELLLAAPLSSQRSRHGKPNS